MQIRASVAAVMLAFAGTMAWAGANDPEQPADAASDAGQPAATAAQAAPEWQYVNGEAANVQADGASDSQAAGTQSLDADDQAKSSLGFTESDQSRESEQAAQAGESESDKMAGTDQPQAADPSVTSDDNDSEEGDRLTAAKPDEQSDETAMSEDDESDQAAQSEERDDEQSAQAEGGQSGDQSADSGVPANLQGKVVVIIPKDWEGSLEALLGALQTSPDAKDIVIVQQGEPEDDPRASSSEEPDDSYEASRRAPPLNQQ